MIKYLVTGLSAMVLVACTQQDAQYYRTNPQKLQQAMKNCPRQAPEAMTCSQLRMVALDMNQLAYELQLSPQSFGKKIIALQTQLATLKSSAGKGFETDNNVSAINTTRNELQERLAVVKWLTSPAS